MRLLPIALVPTLDPPCVGNAESQRCMYAAEQVWVSDSIVLTVKGVAQRDHHHTDICVFLSSIYLASTHFLDRQHVGIVCM